MGKALIFCGIQHCGKSTLGRLTARELQRPFYDTDGLMEEKYSCSVRELFQKWGEEEFRSRESALLRELPEKESVISLGGGSLLKEENQVLLQNLGSLIWCDISDRIAFERISQGGVPPFLAQASLPFEEFRERNRRRREIFARLSRVHFVPDASRTPGENCKNLLAMLKREGMITI